MKRFGFFRPRGYGAGGIPFSPVASATYTILDTAGIDNGLSIALDTNYPAGMVIHVTFDGLTDSDFVTAQGMASTATLSGTTDINGDITFSDVYFNLGATTTTTTNFTINFRPNGTEYQSILSDSGALTWTGQVASSSGGTETTVGVNAVHTFNYSGSGTSYASTFSITATVALPVNQYCAVTVLAVGGGAAGGSGSNTGTTGGRGGGGAGSVWAGHKNRPGGYSVAVNTGRGGVYVDVGGGASGTQGERGYTSSFGGSSAEAPGGGGGGAGSWGAAGGSPGYGTGGGGGADGYLAQPGGTPVSAFAYGYAGGDGFWVYPGSAPSGGGGGGAGSAGVDGTTGSGGYGGDGFVSDISGSSLTYSTGGDGTPSDRTPPSRTTGDGGNGGLTGVSADNSGSNGVVIVSVPPYTRAVSVS